MAKDRKFPSRVRLYTTRVGEKIAVRCRFYLFETPFPETPVKFNFTRKEPQPPFKRGTKWTPPDPPYLKKLSSAGTAQQDGNKFTVEISDWTGAVKDQMHVVEVDIEMSSAGGSLECYVTYDLLGANGKKGSPARQNSNILSSVVLNKTVSAQLNPKQDFPRLATALNDVKVDISPTEEGKNYGAPTSEEIKIIVERIATRIRTSLAAVWSVADQRIKDVPIDFFEGEAQAKMVADLKATARELFLKPVAPPKDPTEKPPPDADKRQPTDAEVLDWVGNELWARAVTEILLLSPYTGPGILYGGGVPMRDKLLFDKALSDDDPAHSLGYACQHLATMGALTRGFDPGDFPQRKSEKTGEYIYEKTQLTAGSSTVGVVKTLKGQWWISPDEEFDDSVSTGDPPKKSKLAGLALVKALERKQAGMNEASTVLKIGAFGPGSIFLWANNTNDKFEAAGYEQDVIETPNKDPKKEPTRRSIYRHKERRTDVYNRWGEGADAYGADNTLTAHVAFVLRSDPSTKKFQCFDTGGAGCKPDRAIGLALVQGDVSGIQGGILDDPTSVSVNPDNEFRGVGTFPALTYAQLKPLVQRLRKSRPLGFGRLILTNAAVDPMVLTHENAASYKASFLSGMYYASPLVRLYGDAAEENFTRARLAWSLRNLPGHEDILAMWLTYVPTLELAHAMLGASRREKIAGLVASAKARSTSPAAQTAGVSQFLFDHTAHAGTYLSRPNGQTLWAWKRPQNKPFSGINALLKAAIAEAPWDRESGTSNASIAAFKSEW